MGNCINSNKINNQAHPLEATLPPNIHLPSPNTDQVAYSLKQF
jgi:hypothetical protein